MKINVDFQLVTILCVQNTRLSRMFQLVSNSTIQHVASLKTMIVRKYDYTSGKVETQNKQGPGVTGTILKFTDILST